MNLNMELNDIIKAYFSLGTKLKVIVGVTGIATRIYGSLDLQLHSFSSVLVK